MTMTETSIDGAAAAKTEALEMAALEALAAELKEGLGEVIREIQGQRAKRLWLAVDGDNLPQVIKYMADNWGLTFLSTIAGRDTGERFEINYHFFVKETTVTVKAIVPYGKSPRIPSITTIIPGAVNYEREVNDILGIFPQGHPNPTRYVLPDSWPEGEYPLRKSWSPAKGEDDRGGN